MPVAEQSTFIKVDRNIMTWRWYQDANTMRVFIHLILTANIEDHDFEKTTIHRGEVATSLPSLSRQLKISIKSVRTALDHLKSTGEVASRIYPHFQVITILGYDRYQAKPAGKTAGTGQASGRQKAGTGHQSKKKRMKEGKEGKDIYPPSVAEVEEFARAEGLNLDAAAFVDYNAARGWAGITDWRPLARLRSRQLSGSGTMTKDDELDDFGRPIEKEFK